MKKYHDYTREERAELMLTDYEAYASIVPEGHWLQILEGIAKVGGITEEEMRSSIMTPWPSD